MPDRYAAFCYAPELTAQQCRRFDEAIARFTDSTTGPRDGRTPDYSFHSQTLELPSEQIRQTRDLLRGTFAKAPVSTALVPTSLREGAKKLIVMDVDSTLIQQEVIELLAAHAGRAEEVRAVTEAAMRGELDFEQSLHARVQTLAGLPETVFGEVHEAIRLSPGAERLIHTARAGGHTVAAVSGGFSQILAPIAARLGLDFATANDLEVEDGRLTGRVRGRIIDRAAKAQALRQWSAAVGIPLGASIAIGDGANDLDMMSAAGFSVAFNAKPAVVEAADAAIWRLDLVVDLAGL